MVEELSKQTRVASGLRGASPVAAVILSTARFVFHCPTSEGQQNDLDSCLKAVALTVFNLLEDDQRVDGQE